MKYPALLVLMIIIIACAAPPLMAADSSGQFIVGGGVGVLPCTRFLNAMASARQQGGLTSIAGLDTVYPWASYILGFQTAYNFAVPGIRDIFGAFGPSPVNDVLYGIEPWCQKNPTAHFGDALIIFAEKLRKAYE
ncbi:MAG TPA: hypothetical protein VJ770_18145 [Stellaceae bacterium]|nr:hypothetical protein [Stellaceae bacterium]